MTDLLSLSRAARLAGVSRGTLQAQIRRGQIDTFEGQVRVSDLLRIYPSVSLEHSGMLEEVEQIKANAIPRETDQDHHLPSPEVLLSRLRALSDALSEQLGRANGLQRLVADLREQLTQAIPERDTRERLLGWLDAQCAALAEAPETEARRRLFAKDNFLRLMAASVKVIPSGHEFFVEGSEPILDAAVRAGLRINYGCTNGNCGSCKARIISGEVWKLREHDYVLSAREQQMGYILACCHTAVTDLVVEAAEAHSTADLPHQEIRAQIRKIARQTDDLMQIQVQTPRTQTLRFMAGQSVQLRLDDGSETTLPIASCPCNGRNLYFYVRRSPDAFSEAIFHQGLNRAPVLVSGPYGEFVLQESNPTPAVFIAFDDSIAPIKSLLEHAISIDTAASFHLYWSTTGTDGFYLEGWCRALKDALDNFSFTPLIDANAEDLLALIRADLPEPGNASYYLAGSSAQLATMEHALQTLGLTDGQIATLEPISQPLTGVQ
ncbi:MULTISPECIES: 2Fe-2S iron-sulfur cluster-binding protein [Thiorhodovibrio]|uniref:2Fe-2S iron-sulfur cluster-binding protein n=1 Tax=Thiorhodovibrio TaxID=61593 RepID=UPI0019146AA7|nr:MULTISPECIES: 2Fe-2S iron-sulfur cluster-binding protein [Thiorhodovibrio]MBK5969544.1 ferredoxin [Thiorhodovibrio winogradskyi]WPL13957.1 CDP-6-deoxy-L-threo-D-glycero-4-hexulose-3-dehydrase reductase [Thiorhodovibrio litoralis]